ncbi:hypothetical protein CRI94_04675 [Longibacter salinarum]|uniref:Uncharacterized protein n=1 Tax=Longibacter salinarum TaxID=1850348 RepID=A0A2A8D077_9BACT|nr:hypothetical protein CRI94_04675 [Longibacter salinarum]
MASLSPFDHVRSVIGFLLLPLIVGLLAAGCDSTSSNAPDVDQTLEAGDAAKTDDGVYMVASEGSIEEPVAISSRKTQDPEAESLLPEEANSPDMFYRVSGDRDVDLSADTPPLYTALPVPDDADPSNIALAVRIPREYTTDEASSEGYGWDVLPGAYEPERDLLVVPTRFVVGNGIVFGVVENSDYNAPSMEGTSGSTLLDKIQTSFSKRAPTEKASTSDFKVKCKGFGGSGCGSDEKSDVKNYLVDVYDDYVSDFKKPDLRTPVFGNKYIWIIKKKGKAWCKGDTAGKYLSLTNKAITCFDPSSGGDPSESTTRHEFFHAIQYNYAPISWSKLPKQRPDWVIEATAELTESTNSNASNVERANTSLRAIDTPLTEVSGKPDYPEYRAQDFWVHLISSRSSTPADILEPVFDQQSNGTNKPTAKKVDELYSLADDHWDWVRNQAFTAEITSGYSGALNSECVIDSSAVSPTTVSYDAGARTSPKQETISASKLTGHVAAVEVQTGADRIDLEIKASTSDSKSYVQIYPYTKSSNTNCWNNAANSSDTVTDMVVENSDKTYYVLVAATMISSSESDFTIEISHEDRLTK